MPDPDLTLLVAASNLLEQRAAEGVDRVIGGDMDVAAGEVRVVAACTQAHTAINMALQEMAAQELTRGEHR
jgi:hypothetical protein